MAKHQAGSGDQQVIVKIYRGRTQEIATAAYQSDAALMAPKGYFPTSQSWAPGAYGCGSFLGALLLFLVIVGILVFIYMLIVKPDGTLTVTYELRPDAMSDAQRRPCPFCAELIQSAAKVCRFCSRELPEGWAPEEAKPAASQGAFDIGARVTRAHSPLGPVGEVAAIDGEVVTVKWPRNRTSVHLGGDLKRY
jgi:hypothetical protein